MSPWSISKRWSCWYLLSKHCFLHSINGNSTKRRQGKSTSSETRESNIVVKKTPDSLCCSASAVCMPSKHTQCKCQDCQAYVKRAIILSHLIMRPSSFNIFCRYPSAESCKKQQHSTRFHCTVSDMGSATAHNQDSWQGKSHTWGSLRRFCWHACHQPAIDGNVCTSLCYSGLRIQRKNRRAEVKPIDWSL